jgi:hypothetical protein
MSLENFSFITIATRSYLPQVALLAKSLKQHHPDHRLSCYLVENDIYESDSFNKLFDIISIKELPLPGGPNFLFQYTPFELCCALKPYAIKDFISRYKKDIVVYLDSDMYIYSPLNSILGHSFDDHAVLLTPHLLKADPRVDYTIIRRSGSYNAGFLVFKNTANAIEMLDWWQDRCFSDCYVDVHNGIFVDQGWLDIAVSVFPVISVLRDPGINVGHWNIHEKSFSNNAGQIMVDDKIPLRLFHFSGFSKHGLSKYLDKRLFPDGIPDIVQKLSHEYSLKLKKIHHTWNAPDTEYSFGCFADKSPITPEMREAVRLRLVECENPFEETIKIHSFLAKKNPDEILCSRIGYRFTHYLDPYNKIKRLEKHIVIGRVWRFWRRYINPNI